MPIPFTCPNCGEQTLADDRYAGQEGACVNCGRTVAVPADAPRVAAEPPPAVASTERFKTLLISLAAVSALATILIVGVFLIRPAIHSARVMAARHKCAGNLQTLGSALSQYHADFGTYPPAYVVGPDGKPWHSWRVLILPYLGSQAEELYRYYDMQQPWDSRHNMVLVSRMPALFASPGDPLGAGQYETTYLAVVGPSMIFQGPKSVRASDISDGLEDTILLVEVHSSGITWTEPKDLASSNLSYQIGNDLGGNHSGGMNVATADGEAHFLTGSTPAETIHDLLTIRGGEVVLIEDSQP